MKIADLRYALDEQFYSIRSLKNAEYNRLKLKCGILTVDATIFYNRMRFLVSQTAMAAALAITEKKQAVLATIEDRF